MTKSKLVEEIIKKQSYLCVGLDTDCEKLPKGFSKDAKGVLEFNKAIIDATTEHCVGYKINTAFYESMGVKGWQAMEETLAHIPSQHFTIADAKRGDIGNTSAHYAKTFFEVLPFDAITVAPYMGKDSLDAFLAYTNKFTIVLGLTSNEGSQNFQQQKLSSGEYLYESVLTQVATWGSPEQIMFVVGATQSDEFLNLRKISPDHFFLVPGVGAQGGSLAEISKKAMNGDVGILVNSSREIIYASAGRDFALVAGEKAAAYAAEMSQYL
jgi:orotidine-5'-phosphate decarboxylase